MSEYKMLWKKFCLVVCDLLAIQKFAFFFALLNKKRTAVPDHLRKTFIKTNTKSCKFALFMLQL